jgi:hypothetical protein
VLSLKVDHSGLPKRWTNLGVIVTGMVVMVGAMIVGEITKITFVVQTIGVAGEMSVTWQDDAIATGRRNP